MCSTVRTAPTPRRRDCGSKVEEQPYRAFRRMLPGMAEGAGKKPPAFPPYAGFLRLAGSPHACLRYPAALAIRLADCLKMGFSGSKRSNSFLTTA